MSTAIIVFAKAPIAGLAKTRLIPALGPDGAAALAHRMLHHTLEHACQAGLGSLELCATPDATHPALQSAASAVGATLQDQGPGDLGQRMHRAFERVLAHSSHALLMGTDAPALHADLLRKAAVALQDTGIVFVPALDGGYALVGLSQADARWFTHMTWSHSAVMEDTRHRLRAAGQRWVELAPVADIDEPADLQHVPAQWLQDLPGPSSGQL